MPTYLIYKLKRIDKLKTEKLIASKTSILYFRVDDQPRADTAEIPLNFDSTKPATKFHRSVDGRRPRPYE